MTGGQGPPIERLTARVFTIPTERPESDGTFEWDRTTVVLAEMAAGGRTGVGWTYGAAAAARVVDDMLVDRVVGSDAFDVAEAWELMVRAVRNAGRPGIASTAIAAVDIAMWDLKAKLFGVPLASLFGAVRSEAPLYASGGFTSYPQAHLVRQATDWTEQGFRRIKMKVATSWGREHDRDVARVTAVREAVGDDVELMVDANGGYGRGQAARLAQAFADLGVTWFEEPVSSDDLEGLRMIRDRSQIDVAAGEYGYDATYFARMCDAKAVDVLQPDVSRCAGITEWLRAAAVAAAHGISISSHTAQTLHVHPALAVSNLRHMEYFHDHARVDQILFDGVPQPSDGTLRPDLSRPGLGVELKHADAERFAA